LGDDLLRKRGLEVRLRCRSTATALTRTGAGSSAAASGTSATSRAWGLSAGSVGRRFLL
jgi:hypothetical protein